MICVKDKPVSTRTTVERVVSKTADYLICTVITIKCIVSDMSLKKIISVQSFNYIFLSTSFYILRPSHTSYLVYSSEFG